MPFTRTHRYVYPGLVRPLASMMPVVTAVSVCPTCAVPLTVGAPVAGMFGGGATTAVAALVSVSEWPTSSVKLTRTLMALPWSAATRV